MTMQEAPTYSPEHGHYHDDDDSEQTTFVVNSDPLPLQPKLPTATKDWELSWSRTLRWMRLRDPDTDEFWVFKQMVGKGQMLRTDGETGRMIMRCRVQMVGDQVFMYYPKEGHMQEDPSQIVGQRLPESHWRLCYHRAGKDWRLRNERTGELTFVKNYIGNLAVNWMDKGSHVFHDGYVVLDKEGTAHFVDPEVQGR